MALVRVLQPLPVSHSKVSSPGLLAQGCDCLGQSLLTLLHLIFQQEQPPGQPSDVCVGTSVGFLLALQFEGDIKHRFRADVVLTLKSLRDIIRLNIKYSGCLLHLEIILKCAPSK